MSESTAKAARRAEIPEHVHCHDCGRAVALDEAKVGITPQVAPQPNGQIAIVPRQVPLCGACLERIQAAQRPQIEVARAMPPQGLRPV